MAVPNPDRALIDPAKLRDYILSGVHHVGRFKAPFFLALGYSATDSERLDADLRQHLRSAVVARVEGTPYGQKYAVRGILRGPSGREAELVSVWIVLEGEEFPRFVTAFLGGA